MVEETKFNKDDLSRGFSKTNFVRYTVFLNPDNSVSSAGDQSSQDSDELIVESICSEFGGSTGRAYRQFFSPPACIECFVPEDRMDEFEKKIAARKYKPDADTLLSFQNNPVSHLNFQRT